MRPVAFSPARRRAFVADVEGVHVLSLRTGTEMKAVRGLPDARVVFAPRGADVPDSTAKALDDVLERASDLELQGDLEGAAAQYRKARALAPGDESLIDGIARQLFKAGKQEAAFAEMKGWSDEAPGDPRRCWKLAAVYVGSGQARAAIAPLQCALVRPQKAGVPESFLHVELAKAFLATGEIESARRHAEKARALGDPRVEPLIKQLEKRR
jgi:hypothetical protein